jgi:hypothetical protein
MSNLHGLLTTSCDHLMASQMVPSGILVVRRHFDGGPKAEGIEVRHADPQVRFTNELLAAIARGDSMYPDVRVEGWLIGGNHYHYGSNGWCFCRAYLHLDARNQHMVYRISLAETGSGAMWQGCWPD